MTLFRQYLLAVQSFTRVPLAGALSPHADDDDAQAGASTARAVHFPGVGWFVGLVACTVFALVGLALPGSPFAPLVAGVAAVIAMLFVTGGSHEEGLATVTGALAPGRERSQPHDVRFETRVSAQGVMALVLVLFAKVSLLAVLASHSPATVLAALFTGQVVSRFWPLVLASGMSYLGQTTAREAQPFTQVIGRRELGVAAAWCAVPLALTLWGQGFGFVLVALLASGLVLAWLRHVFARRLDGFNAACIGTAQVLTEIAFYLGAAIGLST